MNKPSDQKIIDAAVKAQKKKAATPTLVVPTNGVLVANNLKSLDNWRAFVHQIVPVIVTVLVSIDIVTNDQAVMWIPFIFAIADNLLSVNNTVDKIRLTVYSAFSVLQAGGLVTSLFTDWHPEWVPIVSASMAVVSGILARFYTPTTTMLPAQRTGPSLDDVKA